MKTLNRDTSERRPRMGVRTVVFYVLVVVFVVLCLGFILFAPIVRPEPAARFGGKVMQPVATATAP